MVDLLDGKEDKSAVAKSVCVVCMGKGQKPIAFTGECKGTIVQPDGDESCGWETIFLPDGYDVTLDKIDQETKN